MKRSPRTVPWLAKVATVAAVAFAGTSSAAVSDGVGGWTFDFEERRLGNLETLPMFWQKVAGAGFPHYAEGSFSTERARSGRHSFRLDLDGGNVAYRLPGGGPIVARSGDRFRVDVAVSATPMRHARPSLAAWAVDAENRRIGEVARATSRPEHDVVDAPDGVKRGWQTLSVELVLGHPQAAGIVVELAVLQPSFFDPSTPATRRDFRGSAWFDDLVVRRVPMLRLTPGRPNAIFLHDSPVLLRARTDESATRPSGVEDHAIGGGGGGGGERVRERSVAEWTIRDAAGVTVRRHAAPFDPADAAWAVDGLPVGWYEAAVTLTPHDPLGRPDASRVVTTRLAFVVREASDVSIRHGERVGFVADRLPASTWHAAADVLATFGASRVRLGIGTDADPPYDALDRLRQTGVAVTLAWVEPSRLPGDEFFLRLGGVVSDWHFGTDTRRPTPGEYDAFRRAASRLLGSGILPSVSLEVWREPGEPGGVVVPPPLVRTIPATLPPRCLTRYALPGRGSAVWSLESDGVGDLVRRATLALQAGVSRVDVPLPLASGGDGGEDGSLRPTRAFPGIRTLVRHLADASALGTLPTDDPHVRAYLFRDHASGTATLVAWSDAGPRPLTLPLTAARPGGTVLLGRLAGDVAAYAEHTGLSVDAEPVFLSKADVYPLAWMANTTLADPSLRAVTSRQTRRVTIHNPTDRTLRASMRAEVPKGWETSIDRPTVTLAPGETWQGSVSFRLPYGTPTGTYPLRLWLDRPTGSALSVPLRLTVWAPDVSARTTVVRLADGGLRVSQAVRSYATTSRTLLPYAVADGRARQERTRLTLSAGGSANVTYTLSDVTPGTRVRVGLAGADDDEALVEELVAP